MGALLTKMATRSSRQAQIAGAAAPGVLKTKTTRRIAAIMTKIPAQRRVKRPILRKIVRRALNRTYVYVRRLKQFVVGITGLTGGGMHTMKISVIRFSTRTPI